MSVTRFDFRGGFAVVVAGSRSSFLWPVILRASFPSLKKKKRLEGRLTQRTCDQRGTNRLLSGSWTFSFAQETNAPSLLGGAKTYRMTEGPGGKSKGAAFESKTSV